MERLILMTVGDRPADVPPVIRCGLNPEDVTVTHTAALTARPVPLGGADGLRSLGYAGPSISTINLRLLFEASRDATGHVVEDVRLQTRPLYSLAGRPAPGVDRPCAIDLVWGKHWSARGTIARLSEVLDEFTPGGLATRSWVQLEVWATEGPGNIMQPAHRSAGSR